MKTRIIKLYDDDTTLLVNTDASAELIEEAICYKNDLLNKDDPDFRSDFEEMQDYITNKGFTFDEIGYISDIEGFYW